MGFCIENAITDEKLETEGVWVPYEGGSRVLVGRFNNEKAQTMRVKLYQENKEVIDAGSAPDATEADKAKADELSKDLENKVLSEAVILGWEGFEDAEGNTVKYTPETAKSYIELSRDFRRDMVMASSTRDRYLAKSLEADVESAKK